MTERTKSAAGLSLGNKILIGVLSGIACGVFFGELAAPLSVLGDIYVGLLQMTVLPYVTVSLITKIGSLTYGQARSLAGRAGLVLLTLWALTLAVVVVLPLSFPAWEAGTFFSSSLVERPEELDLLGLFLPVNPFHSLANSIVPATVLFSICVGVALISVAGKERLLDPLGVVTESLSRIAEFVVRLSPWGTFALTAGAAGTLSPQALSRLMGYLSTYTLAVLLLTFVVLPAFVATVTPFGFRQILSGFREALLTAFATGKLFAVLPMVISGVKEVMTRQGVAQEEATEAAGVLVPLAYPFPNAGKVASLLFIPFAAWFVGRPLEVGDYSSFLGLGLLAFFGSPVAAIPFLLGLVRLPADLFALFLVSGIWCARVGDVLGAMHLGAFTLVTSAWNRGWLLVQPARLARGLLVFAVAGLATVSANHVLMRRTVAAEERPSNLVASLELLDTYSSFTVVERAGPNPVALQAEETRLDRIRRSGELRVSYFPNHPPFCYHNAAGRLVGLDIDLAQRLAYDLGVSLVLVPYDERDPQSGLEADHFDLAIGGIPASLDSIGRFNATGIYLKLHTALLVPDHRVHEFRSLDAMREIEDLEVGVDRSSYLARTQRERVPGIHLVELPSNEPFLRFEEPSVDALLTTAETGAVLAMLHPYFSVVVPERVRTRVPLVFATHLDATDLDRLVDSWVELKKEDGTIDDLHAHWILGEQSLSERRRWSVVQDVLGWLD